MFSGSPYTILPATGSGLLTITQTMRRQEEGVLVCSFIWAEGVAKHAIAMAHHRPIIVLVANTCPQPRHNASRPRPTLTHCSPKVPTSRTGRRARRALGTTAPRSLRPRRPGGRSTGRWRSSRWARAAPAPSPPRARAPGRGATLEQGQALAMVAVTVEALALAAFSSSMPNDGAVYIRFWDVRLFLCRLWVLHKIRSSLLQSMLLEKTFQEEVWLPTSKNSFLRKCDIFLRIVSYIKQLFLYTTII